MPRTSAGLLLYRICKNQLEVLLAHPGGPFYEKKDEGVWSIPKGELDPGEDPLECAKREFQEETGLTATGPFLPLAPITQKGGKVVYAWAFEGDCDTATVVSNMFHMEWPPHSGRRQEFPEVDRAEFFSVEAARKKIKAAQMALVDELVELLKKR